MADELDPRAILSSLGLHPIADVKRVGGGWDTSLWRVELPDGSYALRVFRAEQRESARREALVMRTLSGLGLPVPKVRTEGVWGGRPALLLSWCAGRPLLQEVQLRPWSVWRLAVASGRLHARIHALPVPDALMGTLPGWSPRAEDVDPELLRINSARDTPPSILHLDYHPLNIMTADSTITGVLDWANVAVGDRRADLARTVTLLRLAPTPPSTPTVLQVGLRGVLEAGWRRGYLERQHANPFAGIEPLYVWAGAMMERDLRPKLGRPGVWLQERDLLRIHRWTVARRARIHLGVNAPRVT